MRVLLDAERYVGKAVFAQHKEKSDAIIHGEYGMNKAIFKVRAPPAPPACSPPASSAYCAARAPPTGPLSRRPQRPLQLNPDPSDP